MPEWLLVAGCLEPWGPTSPNGREVGYGCLGLCQTADQFHQWHEQADDDETDRKT